MIISKVSFYFTYVTKNTNITLLKEQISINSNTETNKKKSIF